MDRGDGVPRFGSQGQFEGFVVYGWDITARKQAETAWLRAEVETERAKRATSESLSRMPQELRTPWAPSPHPVLPETGLAIALQAQQALLLDA